MNFKKKLSSPISPPPLESPGEDIDRMMRCFYVPNPFKRKCTNLLSNNNYSSSTATNTFTSHAPGIMKAMQMLEVQFGSSHASSSNNNIEDVSNVNNMTMNASTDFYHPGHQGHLSFHSQGLLSQTINFDAAHGDDIRVGNKINWKRKKSNENFDDGRIHSLPFKKYGPYTCPKCYEVFNTSQKFASHVMSSHYKFESEEEKKKRYISKIKKR
ncbi:uncharacterized protein LOC131648477 [Vicia villosa]|uniref:uncharacterized protein LOC131648476 n=1 Tax=Vicia villosa TaxID=3911 RepID=UPI00273B9952|nr:uncharacterized protein LOC131648476 [Vicia villosa]XP_058774212.1 uncharacterized protein LOC131648477 [Vicia villosa]